MEKNKNLTKLSILVITMPLGKKEVIGDILEDFGVTCYLSTLVHGSASKEVNKELIFCAIKEPLVKDAILALEDKFDKFHTKRSMVYAIPMNSIIGLSSYILLANGGKNNGN